MLPHSRKKSHCKLSSNLLRIKEFAFQQFTSSSFILQFLDNEGRKRKVSYVRGEMLVVTTRKLSLNFRHAICVKRREKNIRVAMQAIRSSVTREERMLRYINNNSLEGPWYKILSTFCMQYVRLENL